MADDARAPAEAPPPATTTPEVREEEEEFVPTLWTVSDDADAADDAGNLPDEPAPAAAAAAERESSPDPSTLVPMSKNARKKLAKREAFLQKKAAKRAKEKEARKKTGKRFPSAELVEAADYGEVKRARTLLNAGADKVSINTAAIHNPELVRESAQRFGSQCIVVSIDAKQVNAEGEPEKFEIFTHGGRTPTGIDAIEFAKKVVKLGAGELLRPLLEVPRDALEAHAARHGLDFIHDPSNDDSAMDRNFLRRQVLPLVASRWPAYRRTVARASAHLAATAQVLREDLGVPPTRRSAAGDRSSMRTIAAQPAVWTDSS